MKLYFLPFCKYDTVIENEDGTITVPPHKKLRYLFCCQERDLIYIFNNLDGSLYLYDIFTESITQLNCTNRYSFKDLVGLGIYNDHFVFFCPYNKEFIFYSKSNFNKQYIIPFDSDVNSFFINNELIIIYDRENGVLNILRINLKDLNIIKSFKVKGIGNGSITLRNNNIYITDSEENIIRCYSFNGNLLWEAITPFIDPIGQVWLSNDLYILYGGLVNEVGYENRCWQEQKPFFHKLNIKIEEKENIVLTKTNAFEVTFFYYEPFHEIPDFLPAKVLLALPTDCIHQKVLSINPLGLDFTIKTKNNAKYGIFDFKDNFEDSYGIGYVAHLKLQSVKYNIVDPDNFYLSTKVFLEEDDLLDFDINNSFYNKFIIYDKINDIEKVLKLRNIVFKRLYYRINRRAKSYIEIFEDGYGTCGDYTALILAFLYKNNIACRSATGYKVPRFYISQGGIISVYYNHTWIEIFDKNLNYYPVESSSDDKEYNDRLCEGQFLGIDWSHIKLYNGKAIPNLISINNSRDVHPFDYFRKAQVYIRIDKEIDTF